MKWVQGTLGNLNEKSALFPCSASVFVRQLRQIYGLRQFLATESPLNKMKMAFYFTLKAVFVFKFFKCLYCLFGSVEKRLDLKDEVNFKIVTSQPGKHATAIRILPRGFFL